MQSADQVPARRVVVRPERASVWARLRSLPLSIVAPLGVVLVTSIALFAASEWAFQAWRDVTDQMRASSTVETATQELKAALLDAETAQRGYLLTGDERHLVPFREAERNLPSIFSRLHSAVADDGELRALAEAIDAPAQAKLAVLRDALQLAQSNQRERALAIVAQGEGMRLMDELRAQLARLDQVAHQRVVAASAARLRHAAISRGAMLAVMLITIVLIVVALRMLATEARRRELEHAESQRQRRELEAEVEARTAELSSLSTHLQTVAEVERSSLAKELHDELGGLLTAAKMDMAWLSGRLGTALDAAGEEKLRSVVQMLNQAMSLKRRVVENLRPSLLDHFGLPVALRSHFEEHCARAGVEYIATMPEEMGDLDGQTQLALFRVAQEALSNTLGRRDVKHVELVIEAEPEGYSMEIGDDGSAADAGSIASSVNGSRSMLGMRHRVESARGTLKVAAVPGQGNRIKVFVPRSPAVSG